MTDTDRNKTVLPGDTLTEVEQPALFIVPTPGRGQRTALTPPPITPFPSEISAKSSLALSLTWFENEMVRLGYAENTQINYRKGVARLVRFLGRNSRLEDVSPSALRRFQAWVEKQNRADKTKELAVTAVRAFFKALESAGKLTVNPAKGLYPKKAHSPLPVVLYETETDALRHQATEMATRADAPDPIPALLLIFFLDLGLRLGEVCRLKIVDIDVSEPLRTIVHVRYQEQRHRAKRRSLIAPSDLVELLHLYLERRSSDSPLLFPQSSRHIQNVIGKLGEDAGLRRPLTPNMLRWTFALTQWKKNLLEETLRERLGLSKLGWDDTKEKLQSLAREPV